MSMVVGEFLDKGLSCFLPLWFSMCRLVVDAAEDVKVSLKPILVVARAMKDVKYEAFVLNKFFVQDDIVQVRC